MIIDKMSRDEADKGWAYVVVIAVTIINVSILPIQQCFGLIFRERFFSLGITATQTSFILHLNGTITCSLGLISGPMMKKFSFRTVAFLGGFTIAVGISLTAFAVSLSSIIITYCVILGIGYGIMFPATSLAMNTYFRKKRNVGMGFSVTLTGLGPILMPLLIAALLENYATTGTLLVLAGIAMHSLIGASLLRPFREEKESRTKNNGNVESSREHDNEERIANENEDLQTEDESNIRNSEVNRTLLKKEGDNDYKKRNDGITINVNENDSMKKKKTIFSKISENLDLALLKDSRYVAVILGMGISLVAETNFNAMIPFVLTELSGLERTSIATVMSIQAVSDITGRLCIPLLAQKVGWTSRNLYVFSLLGSTLGRIILSTWGNTYLVVICVALILGVAKGTKAVFQALIIPDYVPLERLPAASGMQMVCNGILSITIGPIIGLVHDFTMSYVGALHFTSVLSLSCVVMWYVGGLWKLNKNSNEFNLKETTTTEERKAIN